MPASSDPIVNRAADWLASVWDGRGKILVLTGAGISAESGIPTFRGPEGYWRIGSRNYYPEELATRSAFRQMPEEVWGWYLYRRSVCRAAEPNAAHLAIAHLEHELAKKEEADRFVLVTQNVDGLHVRAGNALDCTYQIHGNIEFMRSVDDRDTRCFPIPSEIAVDWPKSRRVGADEMALLKIPPDGSPARPHVLWFDEMYDEPRFRYLSTLKAADTASLFVVIGTSGATTLPARIVERAVARRAPLLVINRDPSPFSDAADQIDTGHFIQAAAAEVLPGLVEVILKRVV